MKFKAAGIVTIIREVRRHDAAGTYFDRTPLVAAAVFHEPPVFCRNSGIQRRDGTAALHPGLVFCTADRRAGRGRRGAGADPLCRADRRPDRARNASQRSAERAEGDRLSGGQLQLRVDARGKGDGACVCLDRGPRGLAAARAHPDRNADGMERILFGLLHREVRAFRRADFRLHRADRLVLYAARNCARSQARLCRRHSRFHRGGCADEREVLRHQHGVFQELRDGEYHAG